MTQRFEGFEDFGDLLGAFGGLLAEDDGEALGAGGLEEGGVFCGCF